MNIWNSNPFQKKIFIIFLRILEPPLRIRFWRSMRQMDPTLDAFCLCHLPYVSVTLSEDGVKDLGYFTSWIFFFLEWMNKRLHSHANASQKFLWRSLAFLLKFDQVLRLWIPALIASSVMWKIPNMQDVWTVREIQMQQSFQFSKACNVVISTLYFPESFEKIWIAVWRRRIL